MKAETMCCKLWKIKLHDERSNELVVLQLRSTPLHKTPLRYSLPHLLLKASTAHASGPFETMKTTLKVSAECGLTQR